MVHRCDKGASTLAAQGDLAFAVLHWLNRIFGWQVAFGFRNIPESLCDGFKRCVGIETACDDQYGIVRLIVLLIESAQLADVKHFDIRALAYGVVSVVVQQTGRTTCREKRGKAC